MARLEVVETGRDGEGERKRRQRETESRSGSPLVRGRGAWDVQIKWEAPLQEVAPQHEGRGSTPSNEG